MQLTKGGSPDTALSQSTLHTPHSTLHSHTHTQHTQKPLSILNFLSTHTFSVHTHIFHPDSDLPFFVADKVHHKKIKYSTLIYYNKCVKYDYRMNGPKTHGQFINFIQISYKQHKLGNFIPFALFWEPKTVVPWMPSVEMRVTVFD